MVAFSPDGSRLAAVSLSGGLRTWDLTDPVGAGRRPPEFSVGAGTTWDWSSLPGAPTGGL